MAVRFSKPIDPAALNLIATEIGGQGPVDVTLTGAATGPVTGSLVLDADNAGIRFVKTGAPLAADTYTLTLRSATDSFKDVDGVLLNGNADGVAGGNYVQTFNVTPSGALLSIPEHLPRPWAAGGTGSKRQRIAGDPRECGRRDQGQFYPRVSHPGGPGG